MAKVLKIEDIPIEKIQFSLPKSKNKNSPSKSMFVNCDGGIIRIQTPKMKCPFGVSKWADPDTGKILKYSLQPSFQDLPQTILDHFTAIEEKLFEFVAGNSTAIFGKPKSAEFLREFFVSSVRIRDKFPASLKCKMDPNEQGKFVCNVYSGKKPFAEMPMTTENHETVLPRHSQVRIILSCMGWIVAPKFGLTWRVEQLQVFPASSGLKGFAFIPGNEMEEEEPEEGGNDANTAKENIPKQNLDADDDGDEDDDVDDNQNGWD